MNSKRFYKGDVVQRNILDNVDLQNCWGRELIGVIKNNNSDAFSLYHRPLRNHLKDLFYRLKDFIYEVFVDGAYKNIC
jgi:hypothetical protein